MPAAVLLMPEATKAVQMYAAGHSTPQIAAALGRSRKAIRTGLRQMGVAPRSAADGYRAWLRLRGGVGNKITAPRSESCNAQSTVRRENQHGAGRDQPKGNMMEQEQDAAGVDLPDGSKPE
jgi:hypothetical protein